jgi:hypothetical protein
MAIDRTKYYHIEWTGLRTGWSYELDVYPANNDGGGTGSMTRVDLDAEVLPIGKSFKWETPKKVRLGLPSAKTLSIKFDMALIPDNLRQCLDEPLLFSPSEGCQLGTIVRLKIQDHVFFVGVQQVGWDSVTSDDTSMEVSFVDAYRVALVSFNLGEYLRQHQQSTGDDLPWTDDQEDVGHNNNDYFFNTGFGYASLPHTLDTALADKVRVFGMTFDHLIDALQYTCYSFLGQLTRGLIGSFEVTDMMRGLKHYKLSDTYGDIPHNLMARGTEITSPLTTLYCIANIAASSVVSWTYPGEQRCAPGFAGLFGDSKLYRSVSAWDFLNDWLVSNGQCARFQPSGMFLSDYFDAGTGTNSNKTGIVCRPILPRTGAYYSINFGLGEPCGKWSVQRGERTLATCEVAWKEKRSKDFSKYKAVRAGSISDTNENFTLAFNNVPPVDITETTEAIHYANLYYLAENAFDGFLDGTLDEYKTVHDRPNIYLGRDTWSDDLVSAPEYTVAGLEYFREQGPAYVQAKSGTARVLAESIISLYSKTTHTLDIELPASKMLKTEFSDGSGLAHFMMHGSDEAFRMDLSGTREWAVNYPHYWDMVGCEFEIDDEMCKCKFIEVPGATD